MAPTRIMSVTVEVGFMSGRTTSLEAELDATVETIKRRAQTVLEVGTGRLVNSSGRILGGAFTVQESGVESGDVLTLQVWKAQISKSFQAFAAVASDGSVATWGHAGCGGDSRAVQDQLKNVQQLYSNGSAFAAILADGSVVTWVDPDRGGESSAVG